MRTIEEVKSESEESKHKPKVLDWLVKPKLDVINWSPSQSKGKTDSIKSFEEGLENGESESESSNSPIITHEPKTTKKIPLIYDEEEKDLNV